jgi:hypothetical protein
MARLVTRLYYLLLDIIETCLKVLILRTSTMNTRYCLECGKGVKSLSGLSRHMYKCPVVTGKRTSITKNTRAEIRQYSSQSDSDKQRNDNSHQQRDDHSYEQQDSNSHEQSDSEWIDLNEDTISG